uniref:Uncharacterized protein n=1 Tax=Ciona intestinalis TaxID=7719 RepID=H2XJF9_CIOIN
SPPTREITDFTPKLEKQTAKIIANLRIENENHNKYLYIFQIRVIN